MSDRSLLPPNATALELGLEAASARIGSVQVPVREVWDPEHCDAALLPWLAWAWGVDEWDVTWTDAQKRIAVANALPIHRHRGTPGAVDLALAVLPYPAAATEWFESDPPGRPYTFNVELSMPPAAETDSNPYDEIPRLVRRPKNLRSHLARIIVQTERELPLYFAAAATFGATYTIEPLPDPAAGITDEDGATLLDEDGSPISDEE